MRRNILKLLSAMMAVFMLGTLAACSGGENGATADEASAVTGSQQPETEAATASPKSGKLTEADIEITDTIENSTDGDHAILSDGQSAAYSHTKVVKTGDSDGDEADFYGENAAVFAQNGASLQLSDMVIVTDGTHANAVFSYGQGTTVTIADSYIRTSGNCSGGLMTTGGGTMNASSLTIETSGNSAAAIRSDRGGGTVTVDGGYYTTSGTGSPVIYSTADITVSDATLTSTASQGVVVEGKNSVTLNNVTLTADNNTKNSDHSSYYQAVMIYQSMSGDADEGKSSFSMNGGTLTNQNGDVFFVNNTSTEITLSGATIINNGDGVFLRAAAAGWGSDGANGGKVDLTASSQQIDGDMVVDSISALNLILSDGSTFTGAVNEDGTTGEVYVELDSSSTWTLTGDSYITSLSCDTDAIDLNGHTLYVGGVAYTAGTASFGAAVDTAASSSGTSRSDAPGGSHDGAPSGKPDRKPA